MDAVFNAFANEPVGFALRVLAAVFVHDACVYAPLSNIDIAGFIDCIVRGQRGVVRSVFFAAFNGFVDLIEALLLVRVDVHRIHCGTHWFAERIVDVLKVGA